MEGGIDQRPLTIQQEEDIALGDRIMGGFDRLEAIQAKHTTRKDLLAILTGNAPEEHMLHMECCPDCAFRVKNAARLAKKEHLAAFLKEKGYR